MAIVGAVDVHGFEASGQSLDLAQEILGREAVFAEAVGQRVRGRGQPDPAFSQPAEQGRDQHSVAGIVQLELVDRH